MEATCGSGTPQASPAMTDPTHPNLLRGVNLYLIGMMGSGKSTLGALMAKRLGYRFFDTDTLIEQIAGQSITDIFEADGEKKFRTLESQVLGELTPYKRLVVATGGGVVLKPENWGHLRQGVIVWVDVALAELTRRLQGDSQRPLLQREDWPQYLSTLLDARRRFYAEADIRLPIADSEAEAVSCDRLISLLQERILPPPSMTSPDT